jgi:hypothetical protein
VPRCGNNRHEPQVLAAYDPDRHRPTKAARLSASAEVKHALAGRYLIGLRECEERYMGKLKSGDLFGAEVEDALRMLIKEAIREIEPNLLLDRG